MILASSVQAIFRDQNMTNIEPKRAAVFIGVCSVIAFLINLTQNHSYSAPNFGLQQQAPVVVSQLEMERKAAAQEAAAEHEKFLARYLNNGFSRTTGSETLALVVVTENGKLDHTVSTALANHLQINNVKISSSFFKPEFVSDNLFANVFEGSTEILNKLELAKSLDALLLARQTVQYSKDPSLENVISAHMQLEVQVVPVASHIQNQAWSFKANGSGFTEGEARTMAEERLIKKITNDTNMSLSFQTN